MGLAVKPTGERSAGNPPSTLEVAGSGKRFTVSLVSPLEQPTRLQILKGASPFSVNYLYQTDSRSGTCGGNKARYARMSKPRLPCGGTCSCGSDLGGEQTRRPEHNEMSATSKTSPRKVAFAEQNG